LEVKKMTSSFRSRQRGFLYVTTGANGSGKNVLTMEDVRELQLKTDRPVCYAGFDLLAPFGWKKIDPRNWQDEPDGTIFLIDEAQNFFPPRQAGSTVPEYVRMLAEHRHRGFDFFIITPHPRLLDVFVRSIVGSPGWHRHLKPIGAGLISVLRWNHIHDAPQKPGSGGSGETTTRRHNKEVYSWYESATLHTAKPRIPRAVWILLGAALVVGVCAWQVAVWVGKARTPGSGNPFSLPGAPGPAAAAPGAPGGAAGAPGQVQTVAAKRAELVASYVPLIDGFPQTAPRYEGLVKPTLAPFPAACVSGRLPGQAKDGCRCWTQQATLLPEIPESVCRQIAERGFFMDWIPPGGARSSSSSSDSAPAMPPLQGVHSTRVGREDSKVGPVFTEPPKTPASGVVVASSQIYFGAEGSTVTEAAPDPEQVRSGAIIRAMREGKRRLP
jgi:zona occludens toxin